MKLLFLTNNIVTKPLRDWLTGQGHDVDICENKMTLEQVSANGYDLLISYSYRYIVKKEILDFMKGNVINLHISYLPWNRGSAPNYWSFIDDTPKGVTLHYMDETLDTGKIIAQSLVHFSEEKTFADSYERLHKEMQALFKVAFSQYRYWKAVAVPQYGEGSYHTKEDFLRHAGTQFDWNTPLPKPFFK